MKKIIIAISLVAAAPLSLQAKGLSSVVNKTPICIANIKPSKATIKLAVAGLKKEYANLEREAAAYVDAFIKANPTFDMGNRMHRMMLFANISMHVDAYRDLHMNKYFNVLPQFVSALLFRNIDAHIVKYMRLLYYGNTGGRTAQEITKEYFKELSSIASQCLDATSAPLHKRIHIKHKWDFQVAGTAKAA